MKLESSKLFLEKLLLKLKTGSSRSIHLNALPGKFARLDLFDLINIDQSLHLKFIAQLLNKAKFNFTITVDFKKIQKKSDEEIKIAKQIVKTLNAIFYQQQDEFLEHGTKTFAFGYPLLIKRDPIHNDKILKAPLLIWYLDIVKDNQKSNTWTFSRKENSPVIFNEVLRSHLESNERIQITDILEQLDEALISESKLLEICKLTLEKLGTTVSSFDEELLVLPGTNKASIEKLTKEDPWIRWSGIFGLYKTQKQSIIHDIEQLIQSPKQITATPQNFKSHSYTNALSVVPLDPSQEYILNSIHQTSQIVIQGPPGTGKSQTLTAVISNALFHGKKCLIVCEKKTALDVIFRNLAEQQLTELCIIIDDVYRDRKKVVDKVRHLLEIRNESEIDFRHYEFEEALELHLNNKSDINNHLKGLNKKCFGDDKLIGLIAKLQQLKSNHSHDSFDFNTEHFEFDYEEYTRFKKFVEEAQPIFQPLENKPINFGAIHDSNFLVNEFEVDIFIESLINMDSITNAILEILDHPANQNGYFKNPKGISKFKLNVGHLFSKKYKTIKDARTNVIGYWKDLISKHQTTQYFDFSFPSYFEQKPSESMDGLRQPLENFKAILQPILDSKAQLKNYIPWLRFLINQDIKTKNLLIKLSEESPLQNWSRSFEINYLSQLIEHYKKENKVVDNIQNQFNRIEQSDVKVSGKLSTKILSLWDENQKKTLQKRTISSIKNLYNYRRNKTSGSRNSLRKIIHQDVELFTTAFPVMMVNPSVCSSIFPLEKDLFDIVLFDEASQLRIEDTYPALLRGKHKIVSGDKHQMPPTSYFQSNVILSSDEIDETNEVNDDYLAESNSLLEYCMDSNFESSFLDFHYRSQHPDLISFSNQAFYGGRLVPMPQQKPYSPISYFKVDGIYNKSRTNEIEANALADYLFSEIKIKDGQYPSIGIATFNMNQRNLIWDLLMERSYANHDDSEKLSQLIKQGLFVKNLENVQGDERDIILISTTFGPNEEGQFKQLFGPISQSKGYQLLNVIVTRAKQNVAIFTSIPSVFQSSFMKEIKEKGNMGKGILYAYLSYAESISKNNLSQKETVLDLVNTYCSEKNYKHEFKTLPLLNQMIFATLTDKFGSDQIKHNYTFGGFVIELAVVKDDKIKLAIITEHQHQSNAAAYRMLLFKNKMLSQFGIKTYFISAIDWFKDWELEEGKLIEVIETETKG